MGYTNETTHYGIPLPLGSDKTTPMDYNTAMQDVDTALFESKTDSSSALQKANQLQQDLATTNDNVTAVRGRVTTLEGTVTTQGQSILQNTQDINDVRDDALDMIVAKDEGTAQVATVAVAKGEYFRYNDVLYIATQNISVGDTIVPNTNCKATNVGTELNQLNNDLTNKNVGSGIATLIVNSTTTFGDALNQLFNTIDLDKVSINCRLVVGGIFYNVVAKDSTMVEFLGTFGDSNGLSTNMLTCKASNSVAYRQQPDGTGFAFTEYQVGNSNTFVVYY